MAVERYGQTNWLRPGLKNCLFGIADSGFYLVGLSSFFVAKSSKMPSHVKFLS